MKQTFFHALKSIKFNKARSIGAALICFVCAAFFTAEALALRNFKTGNTRALDNSFGIHNGIFACNSEQQSAIKNSEDFTETGTISVLFRGVRDKNYPEREIVVGSADESALKLQKIHLTGGGFPRSSDEIALEQTLVNFLYPSAKIGDKITLEITEPEVREAEFTLVGILGNFSNLQWDSKEQSKPMINALTVNDGEQTALYSFVSVLGEAENPERFGGIFCPNRRDSYDALKAITGISSDASATIIIAALAVFTLAVMIIAAYALSRGHGKTIGLMKTAGFSGKTILRFLAVSSAIIYVPSAIVGAASGAGISVLLSGELPSGSFAFAAICCAAALAVLLPANLILAKKECRKTVIENLRSAEQESSVQSTKFTTDKPAVLYAVRNFLVNGKETAASCVMVYLSVVVIFVIAAVFQTVNNDYFRGKPWSFDVVMSTPGYNITSLQIPRYPEGTVSDSEFNALRESRDVNVAVGEKSLCVFVLDESKPFAVPEFYADKPDLAEKFIYDKNAVGVPDCAIEEDILFGYDDKSMLYLEKYVVDGKFDLNALASGKEIVWRKYKDGENHSVGDKIKLGFCLNHNPENPSYEDIEYREIEVMVAAVVDVPDTSSSDVDKLYQYCLDGHLIWSEKAFESIVPTKKYDSVYLLAADRKKGFDESLELINELKMYYGDMLIVRDNLQQSLIFWQSYNTFMTISLIVSGGLALFSVLSITIVTITKLSKRRKVFGFLRAVGLTKRQMIKTILLENGLSAAAAFAYGLACGAAVLITMGSGAEGLFYPALLAAAYFAAVAATSAAATNRGFKTTIIDCVRNE